jgi:hypothetical protein
MAHERSRKWECERVGHLKIGFDINAEREVVATRYYDIPADAVLEAAERQL